MKFKSKLQKQCTISHKSNLKDVCVYRQRKTVSNSLGDGVLDIFYLILFAGLNFLKLPQ